MIDITEPGAPARRSLGEVGKATGGKKKMNIFEIKKEETTCIGNAVVGHPVDENSGAR